MVVGVDVGCGCDVNFACVVGWVVSRGDSSCTLSVCALGGPVFVTVTCAECCVDANRALDVWEATGCGDVDANGASG